MGVGARLLTWLPVLAVLIGADAWPAVMAVTHIAMGVLQGACSAAGTTSNSRRFACHTPRMKSIQVRGTCGTYCAMQVRYLDLMCRLVHRLDRNVSGVMAVARSASGAAWLSAALRLKAGQVCVAGVRMGGHGVMIETETRGSGLRFVWLRGAMLLGVSCMFVRYRILCM